MVKKFLWFVFCLGIVVPGAWADNTPIKAPSAFTNPSEGWKILSEPPAGEYIGQIVPAPQTQSKDWNLVLRTKENYPCANAHVNALSVVNGDHLVVNIDQIKPVIQPNLCLNSLGPATYSLSMPSFNKPLTLDIVNGPNTDRYTVSLGNDGASVTTIRANFTVFLQQ